MKTIENLEKEQMRLDIPDFKSGDTIKVHARIKEGDKERIQVFQGVVIRKRNGKTGATYLPGTPGCHFRLPFVRIRALLFCSEI